MSIHEQAQAAAGEIYRYEDGLDYLPVDLKDMPTPEKVTAHIATIIEKHFAYVADLEAASTRFSMVKARTTIDETAAEIVKQIDEAFIENGRPPMTEADKAEGIREIGIVIKDRFALLLGYVDWLEAAMERVKALPDKWKGEACTGDQPTNIIVLMGIMAGQLVKAIAGPEVKDE